ncbi:DUF4252 domain-containing protein [Dysgonomonas sp. Marseille-P4677]|uniref:DUF4252 domain-containing protein n=1 Tax=Dysgonomonas sp. Marseille-P4677 TaxID=2364790 RepID=UPI001912E38C|nr:DUF4252 domain-containing protein [Dysgonomonas sp. Marseille-P4677]MBK5721723.1 DUF4252 domain-containing protein [Dysgonomonas sp. Marseille-P4677]
MKKILIIFILIITGSLFAIAQNPDSLIADLAKNKDVQHQVIDQSMLKSSLDQAKAQDPSGNLASSIPPFMQKIDSIEVVTLDSETSEARDILLNGLDTLTDNDEYTTLVKVRDGDDNVLIIAKKEKDVVSKVYIFVVDESDIVAVKMNGILTQSDLEDIIKEQTKNKK